MKAISAFPTQQYPEQGENIGYSFENLLMTTLTGELNWFELGQKNENELCAERMLISHFGLFGNLNTRYSK